MRVEPIEMVSFTLTAGFGIDLRPTEETNQIIAQVRPWYWWCATLATALRYVLPSQEKGDYP